MSKIMAILGALLAWASLFFAWWGASWSVSTPEGYGTGGTGVSMISLWNSASTLSGTIITFATLQNELATGNGISLSNMTAASNLSFPDLIRSTIVLVIVGGLLGFVGGLMGYGNIPLTLEVFGGLALILALGLFLYGILNVAGTVSPAAEQSVLWHSASVSFQNSAPGTTSWGLSIGAIIVAAGGLLILCAPFIGSAPPSEPLQKITSPSDAEFSGTKY